jgi:hypothetical protein
MQADESVYPPAGSSCKKSYIFFDGRVFFIDRILLVGASITELTAVLEISDTMINKKSASWELLNPPKRDSYKPKAERG